MLESLLVLSVVRYLLWYRPKVLIIIEIFSGIIVWLINMFGLIIIPYMIRLRFR